MITILLMMSAVIVAFVTALMTLHRYESRRPNVDTELTEARLRTTDPHVGTYGLIWFSHPYYVEHREPGLARGRCRCGWVGQWMSDAGAELDAEWHPQRGEFGRRFRAHGTLLDQ